MMFESLAFRYSWRPYQERVLAAIDTYLDDKRLHIVAAPGAGKTTLGLEVFRRLAKPALVLSPTRVIRDQWISRLADFCEATEVENLEWVSKRLDAPKILTSITYQALQVKLATNDDELGEEESDEGIVPLTSADLELLVNTIKSHQIGVIILDEAHHLRAEWWSALDKLTSELPDLTLVSLTATPPYDAVNSEWIKYEQLCGPIDEEISVPELVKAGTLCAHQDYIWAVPVNETEEKQIEQFDQQVTNFCHSLFADNRFSKIVSSHPWLIQDAQHDIFECPQIIISVLAFLKAKSMTIPDRIFTTLDLQYEDIPELGRHWWQILIESVLFSNTFTQDKEDKEFIEQLKKQLKSSELLKNKELSLEKSRRLVKSLSLSRSKIDAIIAIHQLELSQRQDELRQVVMTDYIRDEELGTELKTGDINLGAWPVFSQLLQHSVIPESVALLTGRLSIIHINLIDDLSEWVQTYKINIQPVKGLDNYRKISGPLNLLTSLFTRLLILGKIRVLVGTRSLLGEGWDAPAINSLILASAVGSFMLTNQMRGRAIRVDKKSPDKISSIWHLVAMNTRFESGLSDYFDLRKRFETFVGLSEMGATIESGFSRLHTLNIRNWIDARNRESIIDSNNQLMKRRFKDRNNLGTRWQDALTLDASARILPSINTPVVDKVRQFHIKNTFKYLLMQLVIAAVMVYSFILQAKVADLSVMLFLLAIGAVLILLYKLPKTIAIIRTLIWHLPIDGSIKQIGVALSESLCRMGLIKTSIRRMKVVINPADDGSFYVALAGSTFYESSLFADCMGEILGPVDSPRYLIVRSGHLYGMPRDDYHSVPLKIAAKKEYAQIFYEAWCRYVGPTELIYTRNEEGRQELLKAKMRSFSAVFAKQVKREDRWQ